MARAKKPVNVEAQQKSDELVKLMVKNSISARALQQKSGFPMDTVIKAVKGEDLSSLVYDGILNALQEIANADAR